jgi:hypothetical protein
MARSVRKPLVCALLVLALAPTIARADAEPAPIPVPADDQLMANAHALAISRWGMEPCGGQVSVTWTHMGDGINARSQWLATDTHNPATFTSCSITYNLDVDWDWPKLCTVVEHELGHLAGRDHVDDPRNVMSPYYIYPAPECGGQQATTGAPAPKPASQRSASPASSKKATSRKAKPKAVKRKAAKRKASKRRNAERRGALRAATAVAHRADDARMR